MNQKYLENKSLSILLFICMFLLYAIVYMTKNVFSSAMASIVEEGFMTKSQTGLINAVFWFVYAPFQVVGGFAVDKYSPYKMVLIGLFFGTIANIVLYFNQSYPVILAVWSLNAIAQFGLWPGVFKIVSTQTSPSIRGTAAFWMFFASTLGLCMSMLVASFVKHWQQNFLVSAIALFVTILCFTIFYYYLDKKMVIKETENKGNNKQLTNITNKKTPMPQLMLSSGLIVFLVVGMLRCAVDNGIKMMTPVMLMESYDVLPASIATRLSSILVVFSAIGVFVAGFVKSKITENESKSLILLFCISLPLLFLVCFVGKIHYMWILAALSLAMVFVHGGSPLVSSYIALRFERYGRIGTISGVLNAAACVGNIFASYIFAIMAESMSWGMVTVSWLIIIAICGLLCVAVLRRWTQFIKNRSEILSCNSRNMRQARI